MKTIISAGRIMILVLASLLAITSCSKDEEPGIRDYDLIGQWISDVRNNTRIYTFGGDFRGYYNDSSGRWSDLTYTISELGHIHIKFFNSTTKEFEEEYDWTYSVSGNTLWLNGTSFTRKKDNTPVDTVVSARRQ